MPAPDAATFHRLAQVIKRERELRDLGFVGLPDRHFFGEFSITAEQIEDFSDFDWQETLLYSRRYVNAVKALRRNSTPETRDRMSIVTFARKLRQYDAGPVELETPAGRAAMAAFEVGLCGLAEDLDELASVMAKDEPARVQELEGAAC